MLISYNWLKDYVKVNSSPEELAHQLTMLRDKGQKETFTYIKNHLLKGHPFPWETEE